MKIRKIASIFLVILMAATLLVGCGGEKAADNKDGGAATGETIKIGANLELSGGVASYGQSVSEGIDLALEEINAAGGVNGQKLEVVKADNKSDAAEATSGTIKLISQDKVVAVIGSSTSTNTLAQVQVANDNKVPLVTPTGTNPDVTYKDGKLNDFVFRTCFIDPFQGTVAANFASNELKVKTAAIIIDSSSDYAKGLAASFKSSFEANGGKILIEEAYVAKDTDFRAILTSIKAKKPDFIFLPGYYEEVGLILKQARELGITVPFMGGDGWDSPKLVEIAGKEATNNTYITNHYSSGDPDEKIQNFVKAFQGKYSGKSPDAFAALGYDTAYFIADAIKRAGAADPVKIQEAMAATKDLALVSGQLTLNEKHDPVKAASILEYKDGVQQFKAKVNP